MALEFSLCRKSAFSFACLACGHCCTGKIIMAGPHEVLGMSRLLGVSTTEFLSLYTANGGTTLRSEADGSCVFVTASGCRVHQQRPLVCRLYPLGRMTDETGAERFALYPLEPGCKAETGYEGTIDTFLDSQGIGPYLEYSSRYGELYRRMVELLGRLDIRCKVDAAAGLPERPGLADREPETDHEPLSSWQDIDTSIREYCAAHDLEAPAEIGDAILLHLQAIKEWLDDLEFRIGKTAPG